MNRLPERSLVLLSAAAIAAVAWAAIVTEGVTGIAAWMAKGLSFAEALFQFLRYFTILTNIFLACLMSTAVWRLLRREPLPSASFFAAAVVYAAVMSVIYEALLRRLWSPRGVQFVTDFAMHDLVPALVLMFWIAYAPKVPLGWRDAARWLEYPAVYFVATELAGLAGFGYPYDFLDVDKLGFAGVGAVGLAFLVGFYGLGLGLVAIARRTDRARLPVPLRTEG